MSNDKVDGDDPFGGVEFDGSFEGTRKRQMLLGLAMEPIERLEWLERTLAEMRALQGLASKPQP
jgi:hypothetical protein